MDTHEFIINSTSHSVEELAPYEGQHVAWSEDGKEILAHASTLADLYKEIDQRQLKAYVVGFVPEAGVSYF
jgi:hypothetical protein